MKACLPEFASFERVAASRSGPVRVPMMRRLLGDALTPVLAYRRLVRGDDRLAPSFLLESVVGGERVGRFSYLGNRPVREVLAWGHDVEVRDHEAGSNHKFNSGDPLSEMRKLTGQPNLAVPDELRVAGLPAFCGGWVGVAGYDTVRYLEGEALPNPPHDDRGLPDMHFQLYRDLVAFDHVSKTVLLVTTATLEQPGDARAAYDAGVAQLDALEARLLEGEAERIHTPQPHVDLAAAPPTLPTSNFGDGGYQDAVLKCKEYIAAGDAFQIVPAQRFSLDTPADPFDVYRALRVVNPSPYMFYLQIDGAVLVGSSPEILVKVEDGVAASRPLAGTRKRGKTPDEDRALEEELRADPKDNAEHAMLVDLHRNDIGRIATHGTVAITEQFVVERYSHVMHLSSEVRGKLCDGVDAWEALRVSLPVGTVSGAPKIRAMQIIDELEPSRRGPYGGAVGYADFAGNLDVCIALRTMVVLPGSAEGTWRVDIQAGAGIVADSDPDAEHQETVNKAAALGKAVALAEQLFGA
ncbi:MAG: anthranilate synthase component I [Planctomycetota bacterium]